MSDYINKNGKVTGYSIEPSMMVVKFSLELMVLLTSPEDISKNGFVNTTITITGGTGIYRGITGYGKGKVEFNPETGYSSGVTETFYTIQK